jgi:hypothetical protein
MKFKATQILVILAVMLTSVLLTPKLMLAQRATSNWLFVRGFVAASLITNKEKQLLVKLPRAEVYIVPSNNSNVSAASTLTDLSGRFLLKVKPGESYKACVRMKGFEETCSKEFKGSIDLKTITIRPKRSDQHTAIFGSVMLRNHILPRSFEPSVGVNAFAMISLNARSENEEVFVNDHGEYVFPIVNIKEDFLLTAMIEKETLKSRISQASRFQAGIASRIDLQFANTAPELRLIGSSINGKQIEVTSVGATVKLNAVAKDFDGDTLEYRWILPNGQAAVGPAGAAEFDWKLPAQKGVYTAYVLVSDSRGGYARGQVTIYGTGGGIPFSGKVLEYNRKPIAGAQVEVNGRLVNTSTKGTFSIVVPPSNRYVVNIRQTGVRQAGLISYGTLSQVYTNSVTGGEWFLRRAQVFTVDPTQPIVLQQKRNEKTDCIGSRTSKIDWSAHLKPTMLQWQNGRGDVQPLEGKRNDDKYIAQARQVMQLLARTNPALARMYAQKARLEPKIEQQKVPCRNGIKLEIPANALWNPNTKKAPTGKVQIALSTIDLNTPDQMPGDYSALDSNGKLVSMESFGAGSIEIGAGNERFNLKPGVNAKVRIPVDSIQIASNATTPTQIPFLYYNEAKGIWQQEGSAARVGVAANAEYVINAKHFSTINADILKSGQSCVAVEVDPSASFSFPFNAEVTMPPSVVNPNTIQVRTLSVTSAKGNAILNLPNNTNIVVTPIVSGTKPDGSVGDVPAGVFVVNTGGPQVVPGAPPPTNADGSYYSEVGGVAKGPCATRVVLRQLNGAQIDPSYEYLQGLSFQSSNITELTATDPTVATAIDDGAKQYYVFADPREKRKTLPLFKSENRFGLALNAAAGEKEFSAVYANSGDLGFGREMHCRKNVAADSTAGTPKFDFACYVTNYGQNINRADQADADEAALGPNVGLPNATVAMEYSRVENAAGDPIEFPDNDRAVKFYAYDTTSGVQVSKADLDGKGERPIPHLCVICHGGQAASTASDPGNPNSPQIPAFAARLDIMSMQSNFLPFDLKFFNFPGSNPKSSQQNAFRNLNLEIVKPISQQTSLGSSIVELVDVWYPGGIGDQVENALISNWNNDPATPTIDHARFYKDVFAPVCRTCHVAQPFSANRYTNKTDFIADIGTVQSRVCLEKVMPHAKRANEVFWTSLNPNMPAYLQQYAQVQPAWASAGTSQCGLEFVPGNTALSYFESNVYPILVARCQSCHSSDNGNANFAIGNASSTFTSIRNAVTNSGGSSRYIQPNNLANSVLYQRVIVPSGAGLMPLGGPNLNTLDSDGDGLNDANEIRDWITVIGAAGP